MLKHALLVIGVLFWMFGAEIVAAQENCTYQKNALGHYDYTCADGKRSTLRQNSLGYLRDSRTGDVYRQNSLGNYQSSDGKKTWRKDSLGHWRRDGQVCREDALGKVRCSPR